MLTKQEIRSEFLKQCRAIAQEAAAYPGTSREHACEVAVFSVLVLLDGRQLGMPGFLLIPDPAEGFDGYPVPAEEVRDLDIGESRLHEEFYK